MHFGYGGLDAVKVAVFGTGKIGAEVIRGVLAGPAMELVAVIVTNPAKDGRQVADLVPGVASGVVATADLDGTLDRSDVDLVFYCGLGTAAEVGEALGRIAERGKDAITLTGMVHPEVSLGIDQAGRLRQRALAGQSRVVGAGWNPGFLLDVLPVLWGNSAVRIDGVAARRIAEMRDWGDGVRDEYCIGARPEDVADPNANPLDEAVAVIADGLHIPIDDMANLYEPYITGRRREHKGRVVEAGRNAGFHKRCIGLQGGRRVIEVEMFGIFDITAEDELAEGSTVHINGDVVIDSGVTGNWFGDSYPVTAARAIRTVHPLRSMKPGLYRPDQLPISV